MKQKIKPHLLLIHSFPTNSIIIAGLRDYLNDYFDTDLIDLPGFNNNFMAGQKISLKYYTSYIENYIKNKGVDNYWLGGISFGFLVANNVKSLKGCKGLLAIEPFINNKYFNTKKVKKLFYNLFINIVCLLNLHEKVWQSDFFNKMLDNNFPENKVDIMLETVNARTFFETAKLIYAYNSPPVFHDLPYVLTINKKDTTFDAEKIINTFDQIKNKLIIYTTADHYPKEIDKEYFKKKIKEKEMESMLEFIDKIN